jgi:small ligand-binding sensory domain FIST
VRFASSITDESEGGAAVERLIEPIDRRVTPGSADLVLLFSTLDHADRMPYVLTRLGEAFPHAAIMGCTACGTIGVDREIEEPPSMALLVGSLPDVRIRPFHISRGELDRADDLPAWERLVGVSPESKPNFLVWADPFALNVPACTDGINEWFPGAPMLGGVASAGRRGGENMLFVEGEIVREGACGVALTGDLLLEPVVSQGCRPIGTPFVVTRGERNIIRALGGHAPLTRLHDVLESLEPAEMALARKSLFLGRVIDEYKDRFTRGDFLIHNITGADRDSGALAIAGPVHVGTTVQFHVRDGASADQDIRDALLPHRGSAVEAVMLFGCNGRGTQMWPEPDHDITVAREVLGDVPIAGMFCAGEFGPVGGKNFIHGFTASMALIKKKGSGAFS